MGKIERFSQINLWDVFMMIHRCDNYIMRAKRHNLLIYGAEEGFQQSEEFAKNEDMQHIRKYADKSKKLKLQMDCLFNI